MEILVKYHDASASTDRYAGTSQMNWTVNSANALTALQIHGTSVTLGNNDYIEYGPVKKDGSIYVYQRYTFTV